MCEQCTGPSSRLRRNTLVPESIATTIPRAQPNLHQTFFLELTSGEQRQPALVQQLPTRQRRWRRRKNARLSS